jgi:hypothetical protein
MDSLGRLLLRVLLVPLGYFVAVVIGTLVIVFGSWKLGVAAADPDAQPFALFGFVFAAPVLLVMLLSMMWLPAAIGVLISETFAIRSWIFHVGNGAVSAWIGWSLFGYIDDSPSRSMSRSRSSPRVLRGIGLLGDRRLERGLLETGISCRSVGAASAGASHPPEIR